MIDLLTYISDAAIRRQENISSVYISSSSSSSTITAGHDQDEITDSNVLEENIQLDESSNHKVTIERLTEESAIQDSAQEMSTISGTKNDAQVTTERLSEEFDNPDSVQELLTSNISEPNLHHHVSEAESDHSRVLEESPNHDAVQELLTCANTEGNDNHNFGADSDALLPDIILAADVPLDQEYALIPSDSDSSQDREVYGESERREDPTNDNCSYSEDKIDWPAEAVTHQDYDKCSEDSLSEEELVIVQDPSEHWHKFVNSDNEIETVIDFAPFDSSKIEEIGALMETSCDESADAFTDMGTVVANFSSYSSPASGDTSQGLAVRSSLPSQPVNVIKPASDFILKSSPDPRNNYFDPEELNLQKSEAETFDIIETVCNNSDTAYGGQNVDDIPSAFSAKHTEKEITYKSFNKEDLGDESTSEDELTDDDLVVTKLENVVSNQGEGSQLDQERNMSNREMEALVHMHDKSDVQSKELVQKLAKPQENS